MLTLKPAQGTHVLRFRVPIQQYFDSDIRLHSDRQILEAKDSRPLHRRDRVSLCLRVYVTLSGQIAPYLQHIQSRETGCKSNLLCRHVS